MVIYKFHNHRFFSKTPALLAKTKNGMLWNLFCICWSLLNSFFFTEKVYRLHYKFVGHLESNGWLKNITPSLQEYCFWALNRSLRCFAVLTMSSNFFIASQPLSIFLSISLRNAFNPCSWTFFSILARPLPLLQILDFCSVDMDDWING